MAHIFKLLNQQFVCLVLVPYAFASNECSAMLGNRTVVSCADPGIFVRGGGIQVSLTKKALTTSSAYFTEVKWSISKKSIIFQGSRGGPTFSRGGGGGRGSSCLFPVETHITCDFPGGSGPPVPPPPPLDPHLCIANVTLLLCDCIKTRILVLLY